MRTQATFTRHEPEAGIEFPWFKDLSKLKRPKTYPHSQVYLCSSTVRYLWPKTKKATKVRFTLTDKRQPDSVPMMWDCLADTLVVSVREQSTRVLPTACLLSYLRYKKVKPERTYWVRCEVIE